MSGLIFLHGGGYCVEQIKGCIRSFVQNRKIVTVLFDKDPGDCLSIIKKTWLEHSQGRTIRFIVPKHARLTKNDLQWLSESDAIFINGGDTLLYQRLYAKGKARSIISKRFAEGANIGGSSAGALILSRQCIVWGNKLIKKGKSFNLCCAQPSSDSKNTSVSLKTGAGIGVLNSTVVDVHGSEWGRLPRLIEAMKQLKAREGLMIDEDTYVIIHPNSSRWTIKGNGRIYRIKAVKTGHVVSVTPA